MNILIVKPSSLGDIVHTLPALPALKNAYPEAHVWWLIHPGYAPLLPGPPLLSGLKNRLRKRRADFSEKEFGYGGFLQFVKAAQARGFVDLTWDDDAEDYRVRVPEPAPDSADD